ncbi:hypothetical protein JHK87_027185 [Glycine soja]|nr:hypothetical protein JHK87_027185 [Glycine soja]
MRIEDEHTLLEDRQRALLQLQLKVMSDKPKEDQEVNSKQVVNLEDEANLMDTLNQIAEKSLDIAGTISFSRIPMLHFTRCNGDVFCNNFLTSLASLSPSNSVFLDPSTNFYSSMLP